MLFELGISQRLLQPHNFRNYVTMDEDTIHCITNWNFNQSSVIIISHLGNFPLAGFVASYLHFPPIRTVIRKMKNPYINTYIMNFLYHGGNQIVVKEKAYASFQEAMENNISPILVSDQHAGRRALYVDFMGKKAFTAAGAPALIRNHNAPFKYAELFRVGMFKFKFVFSEIPLPPFTDDKQHDLETIATIMNKVHEYNIRKYPEQWFWMHRRWRDEKPEPYIKKS